MEVTGLERKTQYKGEISSRGVVRLFKKQLRGARRILDVGGGNGALAREISRVMGKPTVCLDLHASYEGQTRADLRTMPFADGAFDAALCVDVIEHLPDAVLAAGLREVRRVLAPGGRALFCTLLDEDLTRLACRCPDCGRVFHRVGHVQTFTTAELGALMREAGLRVDRTLALHLNTYSDYPVLAWPLLWRLAPRLLPEGARRHVRHDVALFVTRP